MLSPAKKKSMSDDQIQTRMHKMCYIRTNLCCRREWRDDFEEIQRTT